MSDVKYTAVVIFGLVSSHSFGSNEPFFNKELEPGECKAFPKMTFERHNIFDKEESDFGIIHQWANGLHIKTQKFTLENESSFFTEKCRPVEKLIIQDKETC